VSEALPVVYAEPDVGEVIATEGRIVSTPFPPPPPPIPPAPPVTILVTVSPFPVKLAVTLTVVAGDSVMYTWVLLFPTCECQPLECSPHRANDIEQVLAAIHKGYCSFCLLCGSVFEPEGVRWRKI